MRGNNLHIRCKEAARGIEEHRDQAQTGTCARAPCDKYLRHLHDYVDHARQHTLRCAIAGGSCTARLIVGEQEGNGKAEEDEAAARQGGAPLRQRGERRVVVGKEVLHIVQKELRATSCT